MSLFNVLASGQIEEGRSGSLQVPVLLQSFGDGGDPLLE